MRAGGLAGYQITVRNRGAGSDRNVQVCDRVPRGMTFVRADRPLRRVGGRRCLVIPRLGPGQRVSIHVTLRVDANAPPGTLANIADVTPGVETAGLAHCAGNRPGPGVAAAPGAPPRGRVRGRVARSGGPWPS